MGAFGCGSTLLVVVDIPDILELARHNPEEKVEI
jgi:hypothetical protein